MSGIKFLLDTNIILGLITRLELLGFPGITHEEDVLIRQRLEQFTCLSISPAVEDKAIELRRARRVKLPDALIAATALCHGLELLTLDQGLKAVASNHR